ncbi:MAG: NUDIX hydrolase [Bacteroidetes bacterium]|nr:NUDIX hydrolase [Bacteroidota bacterium]
MLKKLDTISSKTILENPYWEYRRDQYNLPSDTIAEYYYVHTPGSTIVIPRCDDGTFLLVKQYRYLLRDESIEFPCGGLKKELPPEENARLELREEAGCMANTIQLIGKFAPCKGLTDEICYVYFAEGLTFVVPEPEDSEEFEILSLTSNQINNLIQKGELWDGMTLAAWTLYQRSEFALTH